MDWDEIGTLWEQIKNDGAKGWEAGKALEYMVVRAFALSGLEVGYPYYVPPEGKQLEQIDGIVYLDGLAFLLECKDRSAPEDIEAFAKLRNQLLRRPDTALGCLFVTSEFTRTALTLADYSVPQRILLWSGADIEGAILSRNFASTLRDKYRNLCKHGLTDHSPNYRSLEVR
jgi:hypothetical protein